jgi:capsular exopolysaccharide synthesis family protein
MSKVHEALKRAQEERSSVALQVTENVSGASTEATATIFVTPAVQQGGPDVTNSSSPSEKAVLGDAIIMGATSIALGRAPIPAEAPISEVASAKAPMPPVLSEHRPHAPAAGRDPRTGQFLRFEDLLKCCAKPAWVVDPRNVAFSESNKQAAGTEQFRTLRTRLYQLRETTPLKRILVTSALTGEGKTFVASNLGQAIAREKERKVLLIDGDLRSPALHKHLAAPSTPGLSDYLRGHASDPEIIQHGQEGNLCFIAAGSSGSDPSELLSNGMLDKLLDRLAPLFDWVIIDSPPCLPVSDANVLASLCDGVLLVLRAKSTPSAVAEKARKELLKRKVIGVVMNAVEETDTYGGYAYGYGTKNNGNGTGLKLT